MASSASSGSAGWLVGRWLADFRQDVVVTYRQCRKSPAATLAIVLSLSIGIGAVVTLVAAINQILLRPPAHVKEPQQVVRLLQVSILERGGVFVGGAANYPMVLDLKTQVPAFAGVAGFTSRQLSMGTGPEALDIRASIVSAEYFTLLGVRPLVGRLFSSADGYPTGAITGGPPLAVLSYGFWQRQFAGEPTIHGRVVRIGGTLYTVIGVTPPRFKGADKAAPDVWLPFTVAASDPAANIDIADRSRYALSIVARLKPSATRQVVEQQASAAWQIGDRAMGASDSVPPRVITASLIRGRGPDAPPEVRVTLWLAGISALVLLITCANVTNLLLARAFSRRHEIATRLALGATRRRLVRQMMTEGVILAMVSAIGALWIATLFGPLISRMLPDHNVGQFFDPWLFSFTAVVALGAGILISLAPAAHHARGGITSDLRTSAAAGTTRGPRLRAGLLVGQSALCMAMLVLAAVFALSLKRVTSLDLALDVQHTVRALVNLERLPLSNEALSATYEEMLRRVRSVPGVVNAALAGSDPYQAGRAVAAHTANRDASYFWQRGVRQVAMEAPVGDGFFTIVGAPMQGRDFTPGDDQTAPAVAIINAPLAKILYGNDDALGQCIVLPVQASDRSAECATVVGVLSGVWYLSILNRDKPIVYVPLAQRKAYYGYFRPQGVFVRTEGDPAAVVEPIRRALQGVRSDLPAVRVTLMRDMVAAETKPWQLGATLFGLFGAVAFVIAIVGLYGIVAFATTQRSFEIAVRMALGARVRDILVLVAGSGLAAVSIGLAIGALGALAMRKWVGPLLFQTTPDDPRILAGVAVVLLAAAAVAVLGPTVRAVRLDAAQVLRAG